MGGTWRIFQPTPSSRRETSMRGVQSGGKAYFNPLPPRGGRPDSLLRGLDFSRVFQPTPSSRRETQPRADDMRRERISTHSLLAEGDVRKMPQRQAPRISTHSLLAEGDRCTSPRRWRFVRFQPTPSSRRETLRTVLRHTAVVISTHSLLAEGDAASVSAFFANILDFNPLPPRGGRRGHPRGEGA